MVLNFCLSYIIDFVCSEAFCISPVDSSSLYIALNPLTLSITCSFVIRYLDFCMDPQKVRTQDFFSAINYAAAGPYGEIYVWNWVQEVYPQLIDRWAHWKDTEMETKPFWQNFRHWLHQKLSKWHLSMKPVAKIVCFMVSNRHRFAVVWRVSDLNQDQNGDNITDNNVASFLIENFQILMEFSWACCQIHKIAGCACSRNAGNVSPAWRTCRDACWDR